MKQETENVTTIETPIEKPLSNYSLSIAEQEVTISWMRDEDFAIIYASDSTAITKLDKLCKTSPDMYQLLKETKVSKTYRCNDKSLISFRSKKREMSEEQKQAAGERMKKYQESKRS